MSQHHATLLTIAEQQQFDAKPTLTDREREWVFTLNEAEHAACDKFESAFIKAHYILFLGYFRVKKMRFALPFGKIKQDLDYIYSRYFPHAKRLRRNIDKLARSRIYRLIFQMNDYSLWVSYWQDKLTEYLSDLTHKCMNKRYLLDEALIYLETHFIEIPSYTTLDKLIAHIVQRIEDKLLSCVKTSLSYDELKSVKALVEKNESGYGLTFLKQAIKDFSYEQTTVAIKQNQRLRELYPLAKRMLEASGLSLATIHQFALVPQQYPVNQLKQFKPTKAALYLLCFVFYQHQKINDHLVQAFTKLIRKYRDQAQEHVQKRQLEDAEVVTQRANKFADILKLFIDQTVHDDTPFSAIKTLVFQFLSETDIPIIVRYFEGVEHDKAVYAWEYYDGQMATLIRNLRRLFLAIEFNASGDQPLLATQLQRAQTGLASSTPDFVLDKHFVEKAEWPYLFSNNVDSPTVQAHRREWAFYQKLPKYLEPSELFVHHSVQYKALPDYFLPRSRFTEQSFARLKVPHTQQAAAGHLADLQAQFETLLQQTNEGLSAQKNAFINVVEDGKKLKWHRPFKAKIREHESIFSHTQHPESIIQLMRWIDQQTEFSSLFRHTRTHAQNASFDWENVMACVIGQGTNAGLFKLAKLSDRTHQGLLQTQSSYVNLASLRAANDCLVNLISALPIYNYYKNELGQLHASVDGQKFEALWRSAMARYAPKYFGMQPGISIMTLIAGPLLLRTKVIAANDHESHHLYDLLFNNSTDILPDIISTDQHGANAFNFAILNAFGYQFAPRYAKFKHKFEHHFFLNAHATGKDLLALKKEIDWPLILEEWDNLVQIFVSLDQKHSSQALLINKLCRYKKFNKTLKALSEYNRVYQLMYFLQYADNELFRQQIQGALNNGESFHQMNRAIATANGRDAIKGRSALDFELWNESAKLISNCILYYNAFVLSELLDYYRRTNNQRGIDRVLATSPASWAHVNLSGYFEFASNDDRYDIAAIIDALKRVA